jgi:hypothetical protein
MKTDFLNDEEIRKILIMFDFSNYIAQNKHDRFFLHIFKNPINYKV